MSQLLISDKEEHVYLATVYSVHVYLATVFNYGDMTTESTQGLSAILSFIKHCINEVENTTDGEIFPGCTSPAE